MTKVTYPTGQDITDQSTGMLNITWQRFFQDFWKRMGADDTKAMFAPRMTTSQRDSLAAENGMIIYNSTTDKFQGYENGSWTNLI